MKTIFNIYFFNKVVVGLTAWKRKKKREKNAENAYKFIRIKTHTKGVFGICVWKNVFCCLKICVKICVSKKVYENIYNII